MTEPRDTEQREAERWKALDALSPAVLSGLNEGVKLATELRDWERRRRFAIVVCELEDARDRDMGRALRVAQGDTQLEAPPDTVTVFIQEAVLVTNLAWSLEYEVPDLPDPPVGRMRVFVFAGGRALVDTMLVEHEDDVVREDAEEEAADRAFCKRILQEKDAVVRRAVSVLLADEAVRLGQIAVVFGARSKTALAVYGELRQLPGNRSFPPELPPGVPVVNVRYEDFLASWRRRAPDSRGIDASQLGPHQARVAVFTAGGVIILPMESVPLARGGSA
ncbi:MAG: hypothetical protein ACRELB_14465 [Polyangiaceae bacterium]